MAGEDYASAILQTLMQVSFKKLDRKNPIKIEVNQSAEGGFAGILTLRFSELNKEKNMSHEEMTDEEAMKSLKVVVGGLVALTIVLIAGVTIFAG